MRTRTPPAARNRLDTPAIYTTCIAPNCHRVGIHDLLQTNIDLTQPAAGGRWKLDLARALHTLDRLIDPPA